MWHSSIVLLDLCRPRTSRSCIWIMSEAYHRTINYRSCILTVELLSSLLSFSGRAFHTCLPRTKVVLLQSAILAVSWRCILEDIMCWSDFYCVCSHYFWRIWVRGVGPKAFFYKRRTIGAEFQLSIKCSSVAAIPNCNAGKNSFLAALALWHFNRSRYLDLSKLYHKRRE